MCEGCGVWDGVGRTLCRSSDTPPVLPPPILIRAQGRASAAVGAGELGDRHSAPVERCFYPGGAKGGAGVMVARAD